MSDLVFTTNKNNAYNLSNWDNRSWGWSMYMPCVLGEFWSWTFICYSIIFLLTLLLTVPSTASIMKVSLWVPFVPFTFLTPADCPTYNKHNESICVCRVYGHLHRSTRRKCVCFLVLVLCTWHIFIENKTNKKTTPTERVYSCLDVTCHLHFFTMTIVFYMLLW